MSRTLSSGSIKRAYEGHARPDECPTLQVLDVKPIKDTGRYRVVLSDGIHWQQGMFASQLTSMVANGSLTQYCVVRVTSLTVTPVADKKLIIVLGCEVLDKSLTTTIGNPANVAEEKQPPPSNNNRSGGAPASRSLAKMAPSPSLSQPQPQSRAPAKTVPQPSPSRPAAPRPAPPSSQGGFVRAETKSVASNYHPINSLNAYINRWTIKARVTAKGEIRTYQNQKGEGRLFNFDLLDSSGGEIQCTCFNDAADKFYPIIQVDKIYQISKGQLKPSNRRFNRLNHEYAITLNADGEVTPMDDDHTIDQQHFDFKKINMLVDFKAEDIVDVIGMIVKVNDAATIVSKKSNKEVTKRTMILADDSNCSIELTVWGPFVEQTTPDLVLDHVVAIKGARISEFAGHSISTSFQSAFMVDPQREEAERLRIWWDMTGKNIQLQPMSEGRSYNGAGMIDGREMSKCVAEIEQLQLAVGHTETFVTKATITFIPTHFNKPPWYRACPHEGCNRKVTVNEGENDGYSCTKCGTVDHYIPRYILQLSISDETGGSSVTMFNDLAEPLMGVKASELEKFVDISDEQSFKQAFTAPLFHTYQFKLRAKTDVVKDELRTKVQVLGIGPVNYAHLSSNLLQEINSHRTYY